MNDAKKPLTIEKVMKRMGLEVLIDDDEVKALLQLDAREFYKHYSCATRTLNKMLSYLKLVNPVGLPDKTVEQYYSMLDNTASSIYKLDIVMEIRKDYMALMGNHA